MEERRMFRRVGFVAKAELRSTNVNWFTQTIDLSLKGVRLKRPPHWAGKINDHFTLIFPIREDEVGIQMQMIGKLIHQDDQFMGLSIENIDLDSLSHLVRLVELHLGDPELMKEEFEKLKETQTHDPSNFPERLEHL